MNSAFMNRCMRIPVAAVVVATMPMTGVAARAETNDMDVLASAFSGPLRCAIHKSQTGSSVELTGVIASARALAGSFHFTVIKSGSAGSSNINQGNKFNLVADKDLQVGMVRINLDSGTQVTVDLSVTSDDGAHCSTSAAVKL